MSYFSSSTRTLGFLSAVIWLITVSATTSFHLDVGQVLDFLRKSSYNNGDVYIRKQLINLYFDYLLQHHTRLHILSEFL